jgi:hypothetical protein
MYGSHDIMKPTNQLCAGVDYGGKTASRLRRSCFFSVHKTTQHKTHSAKYCSKNLFVSVWAHKLIVSSDTWILFEI